MTSPHAHEAVAAPTPADRGARRLTRGITATWWYTLTGVLFLEAMLLLLWSLTLFAEASLPAPALVVAVGGTVWMGSTVALLVDYRHRVEGGPIARWRTLVPLVAAVCFAIAAGIASGLWLIGVLPVVQSVCLLNWPRGVRVRVLIAGTLLLVAMWLLDGRTGASAFAPAGWWFLGFYTVTLPALSVLSLWWWDVLIALDRARASEGRLAATQERLRLATDVHDLQGHHLQVIALQLELAERLMPRDPGAALEQLRAARASVDEARQGTRDLATAVRSVPLSDEIANAADLLRAAGLTVHQNVDPDADQAPASVLGPIIRETTTNVLRHGAGQRARISLVRDPGGAWVYELGNDTADAAPSPDGSGLDGIARRVADAGGTLAVQRAGRDFAVVVRIPVSGGER